MPDAIASRKTFLPAPASLYFRPWNAYAAIYFKIDNSGDTPRIELLKMF
jgi:hypothetical protein